MMDRLEVTLTVPEGDTSGSIRTPYTSGLVECIFLVSAFAEGTPALAIVAEEPIGEVSGSRLILQLNVTGGGAMTFYPRTPVVDRDNIPVQYAEGFPVNEKIPVYGAIVISVSNVQAGDRFSFSIYLSNSNHDRR